MWGIYEIMYESESCRVYTSLVPRPCHFQYGKAGEGLVSFLT